MATLHEKNEEPDYSQWLINDWICYVVKDKIMSVQIVDILDGNMFIVAFDARDGQGTLEMAVYGSDCFFLIASDFILDKDFSDRQRYSDLT